MGCDATVRLVLVMLTGWEGTGDMPALCFSRPFLLLAPPRPPSLSPSTLLRLPPPVFTLRSCGLLSKELAASAWVDTPRVVDESVTDTDVFLATPAALTAGLVTEVLMDGPRTGVDGMTTSPVVAAAVVVAGTTGWLAGPITGLGPPFISSSSAGSNFRFLGNLQTS